MKKTTDDSNIFECSECGCYFETNNIQFHQENDNAYIKKEKLNEGKCFVYKLFNKRFMKKYTKFSTFNEFILKSDLIPRNIKIINQDLFNKISKEDLDKYICQFTEFKSWDEMFDKEHQDILDFNQNINTRKLWKIKF